MLHKKHLTLPLFLTLIRLMVAPLVLPVIFVYALPYNSLYINSCVAFLFTLFSLTDFFDGYLARRYNQETVVGKLLDPVADKCLMYATLIALVDTHKIFFYWAILIIGREFFVMGLRLIAVEHDMVLCVAYIGKVKTVIHTVCFMFLILNPHQSLGMKNAFWWNFIEKVLIFMSVALSFISGWVYYQRFAQQWKARNLL